MNKNIAFKGSKFTKVNDNITLGCISPEARELLDIIMDEWNKHYSDLKKNNPNYEPGFYGFAYWLVRWSGLIRPNINLKSGNEQG